MPGFSQEFSIFFYKHFPQWEGHIDPAAQEKIESFTKEITECTMAQEAWCILESNPIIMLLFSNYIGRILQEPHTLRAHAKSLSLWLSLFIVFLCLIWCLKSVLPPECMTTCSLILGALSIIIKNQGQAYLRVLMRSASSLTHYHR